MGTDIHLYVERRVDGKWISADTWSDKKFGDETYRQCEHFYDGRNYSVFAILADVRNGRGFAGCVTGSGFVPISEARGWPDDCSPELAAMESEIEHTPSWLTLAELMAYDWTQKTMKSGCVTPQEWALWKLTGKPHEWSGGVWGGGVRHLPDFSGLFEASWDVVHDRDGIVTKTIQAKYGENASVYTRVEWPAFYYQEASAFLGETIPRLWRLGKPEDVRIVFFFDS